MQTIKALLVVAILGAVFYSAWMVAPHYLANIQFQDAIEAEARFSSHSNKSEEAIQAAIYKRARELDIPVRRESIKVYRQGREVVIQTAYRVQVDLPWYAFELNFQPASKNVKAPRRDP